jgi:uncharacterized membrane protein
MATMTVLRFAGDHDGPDRVLGALASLQKQGLITVLDAAKVTRASDGKVKIRQANNLVGAGALGGAFWGMLIGLLFFMPWMGLAIGSITGALSGKFSDYGIDDDFIEEVGAQITPGDGALFLLSTGGVLDRISDALSGETFDIIHTNLSQEQEEELRAVFSGD